MDTLCLQAKPAGRLVQPPAQRPTLADLERCEARRPLLRSNTADRVVEKLGVFPDFVFSWLKKEFVLGLEQAAYTGVAYASNALDCLRGRNER